MINETIKNLFFAEQIFYLVEFQQGFNRSKRINIGAKDIVLNLQQKWIVQLDKTKLVIVF